MIQLVLHFYFYILVRSVDGFNEQGINTKLNVSEKRANYEQGRFISMATSFTSFQREGLPSRARTRLLRGASFRINQPLTACQCVPPRSSSFFGAHHSTLMHVRATSKNGYNNNADKKYCLSKHHKVGKKYAQGDGGRWNIDRSLSIRRSALKFEEVLRTEICALFFCHAPREAFTC